VTANIAQEEDWQLIAMIDRADCIGWTTKLMMVRFWIVETWRKATTTRINEAGEVSEEITGNLVPILVVNQTAYDG
jgi:hypothetical protein